MEKRVDEREKDESGRERGGTRRGMKILKR